MRCPRCLLADIPAGMGECGRCGYTLPAPRGAGVAGPAAAAPTETAASRPAARCVEWFATPPRTGPAPPVVIMDDGDEDEGEDRDWAPRPARRIGAGVAAAVGLTIALGSGAVWLNTGSAPAPRAIQDIVGPTRAPPPILVPTPPDTARPRAAPPVASAPLPHPDPRPVARPITPRGGERSGKPALLSINSIPWGSVHVDGRAVGNTPQLDLRLSPGSHRLRVQRDGFQPYERVIAVAPGQRLRITDIVLVASE